MFNIYKLKLTKLQQEILRLFFLKAGEVLNQRRIAQYLNVSAPAVMKALPQLKKEKFIQISQDKESKRWSIELNRTSKVMQLKRVFNLRLIYESGLLDFLEEKFAGATIILFGSYSRGEDLINSDIDIAVVGRKSKKIDLNKYEKLLERSINVNFYESFKKMDQNFQENLFNGILLVGSIEL